MAVAEVLVPSVIPGFSLYSNELLNTLQSLDCGYSSPDEAEPVPSSPGSPGTVAANSTEIAQLEENDIESSASSSGDSLVESEEALKERVRKQVEWYFSDENLQKDSFLMKHITRNKQGYVSLKLVASLRKVKTITKDWKIVLASLETSSVIQVNDEGSKIRRVAAAPKIDYSRLPRTVLITDYPESNPLEANIQREFARYGKIAQVLVLKPGKAIPLDIKACRGKYPAIGKEICILVEYSAVKEAKLAVRELSQNWRQTMTVQILSIDSSQLSDHTVDSQKTSLSVKNLEINKRQKVSQPDHQRGSSSNHRISSSSRKIIRGHRATNGYDSGYNASRSPSLSPMPSPAPSRKFFSTAETSSTTYSTSPQSRFQLVRSNVLAVTVTRQPSGPDGTRGFH